MCKRDVNLMFISHKCLHKNMYDTDECKWCNSSMENHKKSVVVLKPFNSICTEIRKLYFENHCLKKILSTWIFIWLLMLNFYKIEIRYVIFRQIMRTKVLQASYPHANFSTFVWREFTKILKLFIIWYE